MTELRTLNIGNNPKIKHVRSHVVKPLTQLQALIAHECQFEKVSFLKFLPNLNTLVLSKNVITDFSVNNVGSFAHLTKLSIGNNKLTLIPDLSTSPHLVELRINHNAITHVDDNLFSLKKLKTLDLSNNRISNWDDIQKLSSMVTLTNLGVKGNPLSDPPESVEEIELKEDKASETMQDIMERRYRHYVLSMFQRRVGAMNKLFCQLIVLDMKRVKMKFSHDYVEGSVVSAQQQKEEDKKTKKRDSIDQHQKIKTKRLSDTMSPSSPSSMAKGEAVHNEAEFRPKKKQKNEQKQLQNMNSREMNDRDEDINMLKNSKKVDTTEGFLSSSSNRDTSSSKHIDKHKQKSTSGDNSITTSKATTATNISTTGTPTQPSELTKKSKTSTAASLTAVAGSGVVSITIHEKPKPGHSSNNSNNTANNSTTSNNTKGKQKGVKKDKPIIDEMDLDAVLVGRPDTLFGGGGSSAW